MAEASIRPMFERRKAAEEALRRNQELLQSVIEGTTDAVYVKDRQGRYLMVNSAVCRFVGKSREAILGNDDEALFPLDEARQVMEGDRRLMASGVTQTYEEFVTVGGEVVGLFGIARNITDRKWTRTHWHGHSNSPAGRRTQPQHRPNVRSVARSCPRARLRLRHSATPG